MPLQPNARHWCVVGAYALIAVSLHGCEFSWKPGSGSKSEADSERRSTASCFPGEFECTGEDDWCQEQKERCDRYGNDGDVVRVSRSSCENGNFTCSGSDAWCAKQRTKCDSATTAPMSASCDDGVLTCKGDPAWCAEQKTKCDNLKIASEIRSSRSSCKGGKFSCTGDEAWCAEQAKRCDDIKKHPMTASCKGGKFKCEGDAEWCAQQKEKCESPPTKLLQEPAPVARLRKKGADHVHLAPVA